MPANRRSTSSCLSTVGTFFGVLAYGMLVMAQSLPSVTVYRKRRAQRSRESEPLAQSCYVDRDRDTTAKRFRSTPNIGRSLAKGRTVSALIR